MKKVSDSLMNYFVNEKSFLCCDLYQLALENGKKYFFASYDSDVVFNGITYNHKTFKFKRDQIQLNGEPSVDSLGVTIYCEPDDKIGDIPFIKACHDGVLDQGTLTLYKAYFDNNKCIGLLEVFSGRTEVDTSGGLAVKLKVKSVLQGLASPIPVRMFAGQYAYSENKGVITTSSTDVTSILIPLKPSMNVLLKV